MTLPDLLKRIEEASEPDREIDEAIALWLGWTKHTDEADPVYRGQVSTWWKEPEEADWSTCTVVPAYTASLDAAVALVAKMFPGWLPGMVKKNKSIGAWECYVRNGQLSTRGIAQERNPDFRWFTGYGPTAPLALCAALLKAIIATRPEAAGTPAPSETPLSNEQTPNPLNQGAGE